MVMKERDFNKQICTTLTSVSMANLYTQNFTSSDGGYTDVAGGGTSTITNTASQ